MIRKYVHISYLCEEEKSPIQKNKELIANSGANFNYSYPNSFGDGDIWKLTWRPFTGESAGWSFPATHKRRFQLVWYPMENKRKWKLKFVFYIKPERIKNFTEMQNIVLRCLAATRFYFKIWTALIMNVNALIFWIQLWGVFRIESLMSNKKQNQLKTIILSFSMMMSCKVNESDRIISHSLLLAWCRIRCKRETHRKWKREKVVLTCVLLLRDESSHAELLVLLLISAQLNLWNNQVVKMLKFLIQFNLFLFIVIYATLKRLKLTALTGTTDEFWVFNILFWYYSNVYHWFATL